MKDESPDNESYWRHRHQKRAGLLSAVGDVRRSEENMELYAWKKRDLFELLKAFDLSDLSGKRVLDAGCGTGQLSELLFIVGAEVSGVDASDIAIKEAQCRCPNGAFVVGSLVDFRIDGHTFNIALCVDVLYHVIGDDNWEAALRNIARHIAPGGLLIIIDEIRSEVETPAPHVRFRTKAMYESAMRALGAHDVTPIGYPRFMTYRL